jgi:hypothetical protein
MWCGNIPQVMAALRDTIFGLIRWVDYTNIGAVADGVLTGPS